MPANEIPTIGEWYKDPQGRALEVVAVDEDGETVEIQYFDGEVAEFTLDDWHELKPKPIVPPEDWSGPFDDLETDDLGDTEKPKHPEEWGGPWRELDREG